MLDKKTFQGVLTSDDAAVYRGFTNALQCCFISDDAECWAHLISNRWLYNLNAVFVYRGDFTDDAFRSNTPGVKVIRLTFLEPENEEYRRFLVEMLDVYRTAQKFAADKRLSAAGREQKVFLLMDKVCEMCGDRFTDESMPQTDTEKDFRNLVPCQAVN